MPDVLIIETPFFLILIAGNGLYARETPNCLINYNSLKYRLQGVLRINFSKTELILKC